MFAYLTPESPRLTQTFTHEANNHRFIDAYMCAGTVSTLPYTLGWASQIYSHPHTHMVLAQPENTHVSTLITHTVSIHTGSCVPEMTQWSLWTHIACPLPHDKAPASVDDPLAQASSFLFIQAKGSRMCSQCLHISPWLPPKSLPLLHFSV